MLKQRIITALILLPLALCGFFLLDVGAFSVFIGCVIALAAWEWARLSGLQTQPGRVGYAVVVMVCLLILHWVPLLVPLVLALAIPWWLAAVWLVVGYPDSARHWSSTSVRLAIGLLVLLPAWQGLVILKQSALGNWLILAVMVLVWVADVGAYFAGRTFGKHKLAPRVSPGKSWEGLVGGLLASLLVALIVGVVRGWPSRELVFGLCGAGLVVLVSVVGDLTESMFKRQVGIKDSSNLLPGHGGVLDRIDSLTAAVPVFAVLLWVAGWVHP
jgi:phosphatidate cytidylyltransferase